MFFKQNEKEDDILDTPEGVVRTCLKIKKSKD